MQHTKTLHPVQLVGAGPGDPELLTLKAARAISEATVILVDDLVSEDCLAHASAAARIIRVGKRGGCKSTPQAFIEKLMVTEALRGEKVLRLKGGDPLMFGRAGEELAALKAAGLEVQIINGISAAFAAANAVELSLTHRDLSHGVVFASAHLKDGSLNLPWQALVDAQMSLVFYMGASQAAALQSALTAAGMGEEMPLVIVERASRADERVSALRLGELAAYAAHTAIESPALLMVGSVFEAALFRPQAMPQSAQLGLVNY
jgi:uroporphyrin-III C-methyltransferase